MSVHIPIDDIMKANDFGFACENVQNRVNDSEWAERARERERVKWNASRELKAAFLIKRQFKLMSLKLLLMPACMNNEYS
jgi:hypothetical protein